MPADTYNETAKPFFIMSNKVIVGMGEALWDILPEGRKIGGAPANFAYHVSQFGLESCVVSAVGNDDLGREIIDSFKERKLQCLIETVPYPTGTVQVEVDGAGVPQYCIKENVAWDNIPFTGKLEALARRTCAVCFGSLAQRSAVSRETIGRFIDAMPKSKDTLIVFDANLRQEFFSKDILDQSIKRCNILKINDEELVIISRLLNISETGFQDRCETLLKRYGLKLLILTCGAKGSFVFTPAGTMFFDTPKVEVADTVGAGDSFTATFIAGLLKGVPVAEAHQRAVEVSAFVCTKQGAMPVLPEKYMY